MNVYQTASVHLIRHASRATFPVQGKVILVQRLFEVFVLTIISNFI